MIVDQMSKENNSRQDYSSVFLYWSRDGEAINLSYQSLLEICLLRLSRGYLKKHLPRGLCTGLETTTCRRP